AAPPAPHLVVGTAGHIDHGKSRLVRALTGTDPDRLPEERARGMTIELGFAHARLDDCDVWFVDVPGHEKFIRTMVAGATGVDAALLVVAADDSVMPQTREHAEVLRLLGVQRCIVALTKTDLVDDEWADAVEHETRELLAELGLEAAAVIRTSAVTGRGLDELRAALIAAARRRTADHDPFAWFRLPIDRAFTIAGRGTVVTGSALHGEVSAGDELELWPHGRRVRVRGLQSHHEQRSAACGHMRLAVNLAGVGLDEVWRGCELATPGYLAPTRLVDVRLATLRMPGKTPAQTLRVRLHLATRELRVELRLLDAPQAAIVRDAYAQLRLAEPMVASWGQRFILRDDAEQRTLGGGVILRPFARRWTARRPPDPKRLEWLVGGKPK
ncbi:MAG: selenocysteine-specific translation elongation factor, partial [Planctomycetota bacterium]